MNSHNPVGRSQPGTSADRAAKLKRDWRLGGPHTPQARYRRRPSNGAGAQHAQAVQKSAQLEAEDWRAVQAAGTSSGAFNLEDVPGMAIVPGANGQVRAAVSL